MYFGVNIKAKYFHVITVTKIMCPSWKNFLLKQVSNIMNTYLIVRLSLNNEAVKRWKSFSLLFADLDDDERRVVASVDEAQRQS